MITFDPEKLRRRIAELEEELGTPGFWDDQQRVVDEQHQLGRNDPCWCGSGKKFKRCHGA